MNNKSKKRVYYVSYGVATATFLALIVPIIEGYIPSDNKIFDFQIFTIAIIVKMINIASPNPFRSCIHYLSYGIKNLVDMFFAN